jgi:peptide/nickel transport system substrate-binding protein
MEDPLDPTRRSFLAGAAGAVAAATLSGCAVRYVSATGDSSTVITSSARELIVAVSALAPSLDGVIDGTGLTLQAFELNANLQAGLVRNPYVPGETPGTVIQDFNRYVPYVAKSYDVSDDGLLYAFHLREGLKSPLGNTITADDVVYSFQRKWAVPTYTRSSWGDFRGPAAIKKTGDYTVTFELPSAGFGLTFLGLLANLTGHVYDSTALRKHATRSDPWTLTWSADNGGWGLGPYYMSSQTPDQEMALTANPHYAYGKPPIDTVILQVVADAGTRAALVATGAADMGEDILATDQAKLSGHRGVIAPVVKNPIEYSDLTLVTNKAPFNDVKVRQALAKAIPYEQIRQQVYAGRAVPMIGNINPATDGYSTAGLPRLTYDPAAAKSMLAKAGHPGGLPFTLTVSSATSDCVDAAVLIKSYAANAGFDVTIKQLSAAAFATARAEATEEAIIYLNRAQVQTPTYSCEAFFQPGTLSNPSRWGDTMNKEFWTYADAADTLPSPLGAVAGKLWEKAETILIDSSTEIFVCALQPTQIYRDDIRGFAYRSENAIDFGNITFTPH